VDQLRAAGAHVETSNDAAIRHAGHLLQALDSHPKGSESPEGDLCGPKPVDLSVLQAPFAAINVGLESFAASLRAQGAPVSQVDWRPPAGGNEQLMAILERMRRK
jgi:FdrA protein